MVAIEFSNSGGNS
jgi:hypothetical protein